MGIDSSDENRAGDGIDRRHLAVGPSAQRGPQARLDQLVTHRLGVERFQVGGRVTAEVNGIVTLDINDHRLQDALLTTVDGADHPAGRCGVEHAWGLLVTEQDLSRPHPITNLDLHRRFHTVVIETYERNASDGAGLFNTLFG